MALVPDWAELMMAPQPSHPQVALAQPLDAALRVTAIPRCGGPRIAVTRSSTFATSIQAHRPYEIVDGSGRDSSTQAS